MVDKSKYVLKWLYKYTKGQLWWIAFLSVITGAISIGYIWLALMSKNILDIATGDIEGSIFFAVAGILGIIAFQSLLNILYCNIVIRAVGKITVKIKQELFAKLINKKWTSVNKYHSGEILNRFTSDVDVVVNGVVSIVPNAIALGTRLVAGMAVLFAIDFKFTLIVVCFGVVVFAASKVYSKHFKYLHKENQRARGVVNSYIQECMENLVVIKSFANFSVVSSKLLERQNKYLKLMYKKQRISNVANTAIYILFTGSYYAALVWGAFNISVGVLSFGTLTAFLQILDQIKSPMKDISGLVPAFYSAVASGERLMELENLEDEKVIEYSKSADEIYKDFKSLNFKNVSFAYKDENVLENASAIIRKGELVAIAGPSGIGKSTMMKLILGLIEPDKGEIYLDTISGKIPLDAGLRKLFAYVPQGNMLLSGTIKENISFCNPNASDEEIIKASKLAMVWDFINEQPDGINTVVGERGLGLSEGQVQRISVARALLSDAPILLFDEATSALDEKTERNLIDNLKTLNNKTCIFISHKHRTIKMCDRIISFSNRKLEECDFEKLLESWK
ncbi:MAG: ABC transporter ATP-binding protein [Lachnospirales bacterium]